MYARVRNRVKATRMVCQAVQTGEWARDVGPEMTPPELHEYFSLSNQISAVQLHPGTTDCKWSWEADVLFSTKSAYGAKFWGKEVMPTADFTWRSKAPLQCRIFAWLALQNRCWTSDWLARRGLDHQDACPFCDQEEETIEHILLNCVFAREVWTMVCLALNRPDWFPGNGTRLKEWCSVNRGNGRARKDSRTVIILVMWELWKHRNAIIFDGHHSQASL